MHIYTTSKNVGLVQKQSQFPTFVVYVKLNMGAPQISTWTPFGFSAQKIVDFGRIPAVATSTTQTVELAKKTWESGQ